LLHLLKYGGREDGASQGRILPLIILVATLLAIPISTTNSQYEISLIGRVVEAKTGNPMEGVKVHLSGSVGFWGSFDELLMTNKTGYYSVSLPRGYYQIVVIADDPETPGLDYVPVLLELITFELSPVQREISMDFKLYPGASIILNGSPAFVELGNAPQDVVYSFTALDPRYSNIELTGAVRFYDQLTKWALDYEPGHIVVPSDTPVAISAVGGFTDDNDSCFYRFPQGSRTIIDVRKAVQNRNIAVVRDRLASTRLQAEKLILNGIDVKSEMDDLDTAYGLLDSARLELRDGNYYECFLDLRAAYIMDDGVLKRVANMMADAAFSPIPLTFLLTLSGFGLASILIERDAARIAMGVLASSIMLGFYYYVSPGLRLADSFLLLASCAMAALTAIGLAIIFPKSKSDIITPSGIALASSLTSTFSLATRNLKRRRLRSSLVLASILTLVFGFTAFTSFQVRVLVTAKKMMPPYPNQEPPQGLMVVGNDLPVSMVEALRADPLVRSVAPKTDTSPGSITRPLAQLTSEGGYNITILGAIGVSSDEVEMIHLDAAIINGTYAVEGEKTTVRVILISAKAARQLHVTPGDKVKFIVYFYSYYGGVIIKLPVAIVNYTVLGILDDQIFEGIIDLDGQPIRPFVQQDGGRIYTSPDSMVVFNWKELLSLGIGRLKRINVQTKSDNDVTPLSFKLAKKWHCSVYASVNNDVRIYLYSSEYSLSGGAAIPMLLVLVGLNVLACTLNSVYERRREVATLSLVGLNPSQISYMFLAESGLVAFVAGAVGYLLGLGGPRMLLRIGGLGFLTEKVSWVWSVAVISLAVIIATSASALPALKASTIATPKLPLKWKLEYLPAANDTWQIHLPQIVSRIEMERFIRFINGKLEEMQLLPKALEVVELIGIEEKSDGERDVKKVLFTYGLTTGSRAFGTKNELVATSSSGSPIYALDLSIKIDTVSNFEPTEVARRTGEAVRRLMLQWTASPSMERWGSTGELIKVENLSVASKGKVILSGVNVDIMKGEILGLAGEGRRGLLLAIAGLCRPSGGTVQLLGVDTYNRRGDIKGTIAVVLRDMGLCEALTARQNLRFLMSLEGKADMKSIDDVLKRCGMAQHAEERASKLSSVAKWKLMIAYVLLKRPRLLLLEDPIEDLSEDESKGVEALLRNLSQREGITVVCTGRSVNELAFCSRVIML